MVDHKPGPSSPVELNVSISDASPGGAGNPTHIARKKPVWDFTVENSFPGSTSGGQVEINGIEYSSPHTVQNVHWNSSHTLEGTLDGEEYGGKLWWFDEWQKNWDYLSESNPVTVKITPPSLGEPPTYDCVYIENLSATISGPSSLDPGDYGTWTANVSGGKSPFNHAWYKLRICGGFRMEGFGFEPNYIPCGYWYPAGDNSPSLTLRLWEDHRIKVVVTDAIDQTALKTKYITVGGGLKKQIAHQALPDSYALVSNFPNPFNPTTIVRYDLPEASQVTLVVYDLAGREVRGWYLQEEPGYRYILWDGRDQNQQLVPTGIYIYRLEATSIETGERFVASRKMVLMK